jgi:hypothetical protein
MLSDLLCRAVSEHEKGHGPIATIAEASTPFDVVLHSLPEFEDRARQLRARARHRSGNSTPTKTGDAS